MRLLRAGVGSTNSEISTFVISVFLGLFYRQSTSKASRDAKVYSDLKALHDLSIKLSRTTELGELKQRKRGQGTDFASLREYTIGDDSKLIDWKATARRDRPVVRTYEVRARAKACLFWWMPGA